MMRASLQPPIADERLSCRIAGVMLAAAVQIPFIAALLLWVVSPHSRIPKQQEIFFRLAPITPPVRIIRASIAPVHRPVASTPVPALVAPLEAPPSSGLTAFGQSLFGCVPEKYADLTPDARAHCIKPGEGLLNNRLPDLMGERSRVKDNARWANAMAHKQTLRMLPGGMLFPLVALGAVLDGSISEPNSAFRDPDQWPNERDPRQFMPRRLDEQERIHDAWHRDHPAPSITPP